MVSFGGGSGISIRCRHFGQLVFLPALSSGALQVEAQREQEKWIMGSTPGSGSKRHSCVQKEIRLFDSKPFKRIALLFFLLSFESMVPPVNSGTEASIIGTLFNDKFCNSAGSSLVPRRQCP
jgi:hypothetical protein